MAKQYKICPICDTRAHSAALICSVCGTSLKDVEPARDDSREDSGALRPASSSSTLRYDRRYGEMDLFEGELRHPRAVYVWVGAVALIVIAFASGLVIGGFDLLPQLGASALTPTAPGAAPSDALLQALATNTPRPTIVMATVTPAPPSPTMTPTEGPCIVRVQPGDDLISLAWSCGHRDWFVLTQVLELNDLDAPELIFAGQELQIPRPTPTLDPNAVAALVDASTPDPAAESVALAAFSAPTERPTPTIRPTETLLPGVTWHIVQPNQTMIDVVFLYDTEAEVLQQLNPEIDFLQCDFQFRTGGERCTVTLFSGQQIRVPVPLPTPTLSPTLSGSETPLPTATPTFNMPSALSPADRAFFGRDDLITLRWAASGTLAADEVYRVQVADLTTGAAYTGETTALFFIVPVEWQPADAVRHQYQWSVSIVSVSQPDQPRYATSPRTFTWEGRAAS